MKKNIRSRLLFACAITAIIPFLVGFENDETAITVAGGVGNYRYTTGCRNNHHYDMRYQDLQIAAQKSWLTKGAKHEKKLWMPARIALGVSAYGLNFESIYKGDTINTGSILRTIGDQKSSSSYLTLVDASLDWKWVGLKLGGALGLDGGFVSENEPKQSLELVGLPVIGLRAGLLSSLYGSIEFLGGMPLASGGSLVHYGLGYNQEQMGVWLGVGVHPKYGGAQIRLHYDFNPITVFITGSTSLTSENADYSSLGPFSSQALSGGLTWHIR